MKMIVKLSILFSFFLLFHKSNAFNITSILSEYPDFSTFNSYLTQTNVAGDINSRQTLTVLVVDNGNLSPLSGKPSNVIKNILDVHVILDYYDVPKLQNLKGGSTMLTTLFQTSGLARGQQGFLNITHLHTDSIAFGSAVPGSNPGSNLVKSISSQPYNISVLQVSNVIIPPGIDGSMTPSPSKPPLASPKASPTPSISPNMPPPTSAPVVSPPTSSQGPAPSIPPTTVPAPAATPPAATPGTPPIPAGATPTSVPVADAPTSDAPVTDAPTEIAPAADVPGAAALGPDANADSPPSAGVVLQIDLAVLTIMVLSTFSLVSRI